MFRTNLRLVAPVVGLAVLFSTAAAFGGDNDKPSAPFVHVVIVHLKKDAPADAADQLIADAHEMLAKVPSVRAVRCGKPAPSGGIAKKDYDVGLFLSFDDLEGLKAYEKHELHQQYIQKHGKNVQLEKLTIYDFADEKK
jgi:hypothetical protein